MEEAAAAVVREGWPWVSWEFALQWEGKTTSSVLMSVAVSFILI